MYLTVAVLIGILVLLALDVAGPDMVFVGALIVLLFGGIISPEEALAGFSNEGMITVGLLFIVSRAVENTGIFQILADRFLGDPRDRNGQHRRPGLLVMKSMAPVTLLSAVLNNTPIVTIFAPVVKRWARARRLPPSRFLIPLSYAGILGGLWTLIGTSTNLVVHGLLLENGLEGFSFFELAKVGIPATIAGYLYLALTSGRLLPERSDPLAQLGEDPKEYFLELRVAPDSPLVGRTVEQAGLRNLQSVYLTDIERGDLHLGPVTPDRRVAAGDRLFFAGQTDGVADVVSMPGLEPVDTETFAEDTRGLRNYLVEAVVSADSPAIGRTIKEFNFREVYDAAVVALSRNGRRVDSRLGDVELHAGDTVVLLTRGGFSKRFRFSRDFYLVSDMQSLEQGTPQKGLFALTVVAAMVGLAALGNLLPRIGGNRLDMFYAAGAAALILLVSRTITAGQARQAIRWDVLVTIGAAFGVSAALRNSGLAAGIANTVTALVGPLGMTGGLSAIILVTSLLSAVITNTAAAALMFPVALAVAEQAGGTALPFFVALAVGASASFATPIGYQTNLIVQGAGGYRFRDFVRIGAPLQLLVLIVAVAALSLWY